MKLLNTKSIGDLIYSWWHGRQIDARAKRTHRMTNKSRRAEFFRNISDGTP